MEPRRQSFHAKNVMGGDGTHEIVFYDWGDASAQRTVVCVHGLTRNAHDFDLLAAELVKRKMRVLAINMPGRGESAWLDNPVDYNYMSYAADCLALLDNFHLRNVDWVGTSMGGIIGMIIASQYATRIRKLVMNDIGSYISVTGLTRICGYLSNMPMGFASREEADAYLTPIFAPFGITDPLLWHQFVDHSLLPQPDGSFRLACDPAIAEPIRMETKNFTEMNAVNLGQIWEKVEVPTLVLRGELSDILDLETVSAMRTTNPKAEVVEIPGVGHAPSLMSTEQISLVANWLTRPHNYIAGAI